MFRRSELYIPFYGVSGGFKFLWKFNGLLDINDGPFFIKYYCQLGRFKCKTYVKRNLGFKLNLFWTYIS